MGRMMSLLSYRSSRILYWFWAPSTSRNRLTRIEVIPGTGILQNVSSQDELNRGIGGLSLSD